MDATNFRACNEVCFAPAHLATVPEDEGREKQPRSEEEERSM